MQKNTLQIRDRLLAGLDKEYNVVNGDVVAEVLAQLETIQITKEALEATRLGKHVNELRRKSKDRQIANRAKSLVKKWRNLFVQQQSQSGSGVVASNGEEPPPPPPSMMMVVDGGGSLVKTSVNGNHSAAAAAAVSPRLLAPPPSSGGGGKQVCSPSIISDKRTAGAPLSLPSSASTSPCLSRPTTPVGTAFRRSCPVSPAAAVNGVVTGGGGGGGGSSSKRRRSETDEFVEVVEIVAEKSSKCQRLNGHYNRTAAAASSPSTCDNNSDTVDDVPVKPAAAAAPEGGPLPKPQPGKRKAQEHGAAAKQPSSKVRRGKVRTTQELVQELQRMRGSLSPKGGLSSRTTLEESASHITQPDESKEELMNRFFESQDPAAGSCEKNAAPAAAMSLSPASLGSANSSPSPEPTAATSSASSSSCNKDRETVEDVLAQLPPIDVAAVLSQMADDDEVASSDVEEDDFEMEGLIPIPKPIPEIVVITKEMVDQLNEDRMESFNGNLDHDGDFREWHEVVSKPSYGGDLLHILPYSIID